MQTIETIQHPTDAIIRFTPESSRPMCHQVLYQVRIDPANLSPSGEYIRFNHQVSGEAVSEVHGWKAVEDIEIMEILKVHAEAVHCVMVA
jgi:hypothetical protein